MGHLLDHRLKQIYWGPKVHLDQEKHISVSVLVTEE